MINKEIAQIFRAIGQILDIKGDNPFRIRAYERAAQNIESLDQDLGTLIKEDKLTEIPGIGKDLADKIKEYASSGIVTYYEKLKKEIPQGVLQMLEIPGLGPKTVKAIYNQLNIKTIESLEKAAKTGKLQQLDKIKQKTEENILRGIELLRQGSERINLDTALDIAEQFILSLKKIKQAKNITVAGSTRRRKPTIGDLDILVTSDNPQLVMDKFTKLPLVKEVIAHGETKSSVIAHQENTQVDLRVVDKKSFGAGLLYFTGSKAFNVKLRQLAIKQGLKVNEYGIFTQKKEKFVAGGSEQEIFDLFKMAYIPAELREDRGEIELALKNKLPCLVELKQINGDNHVHSNYSDGRSSIEDIAEQAKKLNYKYIAITDHSQSLRVANGLEEERVFEKLKEIKKLNAKLKGITVLCGTEVDILSDGKLDYSDKILKQFDLVIAAIHSGFKQPKEQITRRLVSACKNKYVNIIAHPTGRLKGVRDAYDLDFDELFKAAYDNQVAMEINCHPDRSDLNEINIMKAKNKGLNLALGTDSHHLSQLGLMELGVSLARRGWLEKKDIINCMNFKELTKWLKK